MEARNKPLMRKMSETYLEILECLFRKEGIHKGVIAKELSFEVRAIGYRLNRLIAMDFIFKIPDITDLRSYNFFINPIKRNEIRILLEDY
jgi:DNA-binding MarR family transcriptional regulator